MDLRLPILAAINLHLSASEEAVLNDQTDLAQIELEKAEIEIDQLKLSSPEVENPGLLSAMAEPLFIRANALRQKIPKATAGALKENDPDLIKAKEEEKELDAVGDEFDV